MTSASRDDRFAPPQAHVEDVASPDEGLVLATRMRRFWAVMVDLVLAMLLTWVASRLTPWDPWTQAPGGFWLQLQPGNLAGGFALFLLAHGYLLARRGQTVGKALLGIRIVRPDGSAASLWRLVGLRYGVGSLVGIVPAAGQVFGIIDSILIFRNSRRCLHDSIADTIVIQA